MSVYSVYEPPLEEQDLEARAEGLVFVKEGFSWGALLVPGIWLIWRAMWLELIAFTALFALLAWLFSGTAAAEAVYGWIALAIVVLFAFEANDLRAASLERKGYRIAGTAAGADRDSAELAFFQSWLPQQERGARRAAIPVRQGTAPQARARSGDGEEVIGLFPKP